MKTGGARGKSSPFCKDITSEKKRLRDEIPELFMLAYASIKALFSSRIFFEFWYYNIFVVIWKLMFNYGLIRLKICLVVYS